MSCRKVGGFCQLFFGKEWRKALKRKPNGNLQVDFFTVRYIGSARDVLTKSFYDHRIVW